MKQAIHRLIFTSLFLFISDLNAGILSGLDSKIGFKNIYLGDDFTKACQQLQSIGKKHNDRYPYIENAEKCRLKFSAEDLGIYAMYEGFLDFKYADIAHQNDKVSSIYFNLVEFGLEVDSAGQAAQIIVDNIPWVNTLEPTSDNEGNVYYEIFNPNKGFYLKVTDSDVYVEHRSNDFDF